MAGLPARRGIVKVGPPLGFREPSSGFPTTIVAPRGSPLPDEGLLLLITSCCAPRLGGDPPLTELASKSLVEALLWPRMLVDESGRSATAENTRVRLVTKNINVGAGQLGARAILGGVGTLNVTKVVARLPLTANTPPP